jgi:membrane dipeptidase
MASVQWQELGSAKADAADGLNVAIDGFAAMSVLLPARHFMLLEEQPCCPGCVPRHPDAAIEVFAAGPIALRGQKLRMTGIWRVNKAPSGRRYQLHQAQLREPPGWASVSRRGVLAAGPLLCLAASAAGETTEGAAQRHAQARQVIATGPSIDLHSHAGGIASVSRITSGHGFGRVAEPMRQGGMAAICLAVVSDGPTHRVMADHRIHPYRDPIAGELYQYGTQAFSRVHDLARDQGLAVIASKADLRAAKAGTPSVIIAAEGADFLEGQIERVDEAFSRWSLRHLQLTHYRVNELGDIQTEEPVHGGLTDFGAAVIRRCNEIGIVVDVAHGTYDLVKRAAEVSRKPLVLSHTSLMSRPSRFSRRITAEHARLIAGTGGVIGVWPPASIYPTLDAMAAGMAGMAEIVGVDHVGLGSDMRGLVGASIFPEYDQLPDLAEALLRVGFSTAETGKILGGNYARVFAECVN